MKKILYITFLIYLLFSSCNTSKILIKNRVYHDSKVIEGVSIEKGTNIIYKHYERRKGPDGYTKIILLEVIDKSIIFSGNVIKLDGYNKQVNVTYVNIGELSRESSNSFRGEMIIQEVQNERKLSINLKLECIDNKYLNIDEIIKW